MIQQVCGACDGVGQVIRNPCMACRGRGSNHGQVKETINIPKGVDNGVNLRVAKKGHAGMGGPAGDLIINVKVRPHNYFKREGSNIHTDAYINISEAVLGGEVSVRTLYGDVKLKLQPGTQHDERKKITNYGIQKLPPNHH
jgi:molecular chaperone DnaJ